MWRLAEHVAGRNSNFFGKCPRSIQTHDPKRDALALLAATTIFTGPTAQARIQNHLIANGYAVYICPGGNDDAGCVRAENMWLRQFKAASTFSHPDVKVIQPGGMNLQNDFVFGKSGLRDLLDPEPI
jgi:hypothetical protein